MTLKQKNGRAVVARAHVPADVARARSNVAAPRELESLLAAHVLVGALTQVEAEVGVRRLELGVHAETLVGDAAYLTVRVRLGRHRRIVLLEVERNRLHEPLERFAL